MALQGVEEKEKEHARRNIMQPSFKELYIWGAFGSPFSLNHI